MNQLFQDSVFFGVLISLAAYGIGMLLKLKTGWSLMNRCSSPSSLSSSRSC